MKSSPGRSAQLVRIAIMIAALVAIIVFQGRCGRGIENLFKAVEGPAPRAHGDGGR